MRLQQMMCCYYSMVVIIMVKEGAEMGRSRQRWVSLAIQRTQTTEVTLTMFLSVDR